MFYFVILFLIHSVFLLFSDGITISSTFLEFTSGTGFGFTILSAILFFINSPEASVAL